MDETILGTPPADPIDLLTAALYKRHQPSVGLTVHWVSSGQVRPRTWVSYCVCAGCMDDVLDPGDVVTIGITTHDGCCTTCKCELEEPCLNSSTS